MSPLLEKAALHLGKARLAIPKPIETAPGVHITDLRDAALHELADCLEAILKHLESDVGGPRPALELQTFGSRR